MRTLFSIPLAQIAELICLIAAILLLKSARPKFWRNFIWYLAMTVAVESIAYYVSHYKTGYSTHSLYNLFLAIYGIFHIWIFSKIILLPKIKEISLLLLFVFIGSYVWEWNLQGFNHYFFKTNTLFGIEVTLLSIVYFYSLFKQENYIPILKEPAFWFVTGCLIFYATSTGVNAFFAELLRGNYKIRVIIITILNVVMYTCWIKSFLCFRKNQISTL